MIGNPEFKDDFDFMPYQEYSMDGQHHSEDFMLRDWARKQAVSWAHSLSSLLIMYII